MKRSKITLMILYVLFILPNKSKGQWIELGNNNLATDCIHIDENNSIYLAGEFWNHKSKHNIVYKVGNYWSELGGKSFGLNANGLIKEICTDQFNNVYAAGQFTNKSGNRYVAKYDGNSWQELGGHNGLAANGWINTICKDKKGNIYVAGNFTKNQNKYYVAQWNGQKWSELGSQDTFTFNGPINSLCSDSFGNIYAAGYFTNGPYPTGKKFVAVWNGNSWKELGGKDALASIGFISDITKICADEKGSLFAAGKFRFVAKWDGSNWSKLGGQNAPLFNNDIFGMNYDSKGNLFVGGEFTNSNGKHYIAKWNGNSWIELKESNQLASDIGRTYNIKNNSSGEIFIAASNLFTNRASYIAKWDGNWTSFGGTNKPYSNINSKSAKFSKYGDIYEATYGDTTLSLWNGITWVKINSSNDYKLNSQGFAFDKYGNYYRSVLNLKNYGGHIQKFNGISWEVIGNDSNMFKGGVGGYDIIWGMIVDDFSNIYTIGNWNDQWSRNWIYKWDGSTLSKLGNGLFNGYIEKICKDLNGNIYIAGYFKNTSGNYYIAKWNGSNFSEVGLNTTFKNLKEWGNIETDKQGNIVACGLKTDGKPLITKWDGQKWIELGNISDSLKFIGKIYDLVIDSKNNIIVIGAIDSNAYTKPAVAKWNGQNWIELKSLSLFGHYNLSLGLTLGIDKFDNIYAKLRGKKGPLIIVKWENCQNLISVQPKDIITQINSKAFFTISANRINSKFQWLKDNGLGYEDIINSSQYSGATKDTLFILNLNSTNNFQLYKCKVTNDLCSEISDPAMLSIEPNLSIEQDFISVTAYPNPTSSLLNLKVRDELIGEKYFIYNSTGVIVATGTLKYTNTIINFENLNSGIYFINIGAQSNNSIKIIKRL